MSGSWLESNQVIIYFSSFRESFQLAEDSSYFFMNRDSLGIKLSRLPISREGILRLPRFRRVSRGWR